MRCGKASLPVGCIKDCADLKMTVTVNGRQMMQFDTIVIGGGLEGLCCAIRLAEQGKHCAVISAGQSALYFSSGSLDLLCRLPDGTPVTSPPAALDALASQAPGHPY